MKILIITPSYKPAYYYGGPIYSVAYLAQNLNLQNEVLVLSTLANGTNELELQSNFLHFIEGVSVRFFKRQTKDHSHFSIGLFVYFWKHASYYDVIHIQSWWNLIALGTALIARIKGLNYIISPRGMLSPYTYQGSIFKKIIHFVMGNYLLKKSTLHLTSSDEEIKVKQLNPQYKTFVLPNYIDTNITLFERTKSDKFNILYLGRIHPKKGLDILLESLSSITIDFELNVIGEGDINYKEELKFKAKTLGMNSNIKWLGSKLAPEKFQFYTNADVMVLPSKDENFANTVLESLMCGTAVILSKQVGLADFVNRHELGWVYNENVNDLKETIVEAFNDSAKRERIRTEAPGFISNEFNVEELTKMYLLYYTKQWV